MLVYRITPRIYSHSLHGPGIAGRWNSAGRKVIYAAESIPVAFMENMIRRKGIGFNDQFAIMCINIPDALVITEVDPSTLAPGWRNYKDYAVCQTIGNAWYDERLSCLLKVPSAVLPTNFNYVLHTEHPDFSKIRVIATSDLLPDERIEDLLKKYSPS